MIFMVVLRFLNGLFREGEGLFLFKVVLFKVCLDFILLVWKVFVFVKFKCVWWGFVLVGGEVLFIVVIFSFYFILKLLEEFLKVLLFSF